MSDLFVDFTTKADKANSKVMHKSVDSVLNDYGEEEEYKIDGFKENTDPPLSTRIPSQFP